MNRNDLDKIITDLLEEKHRLTLDLIELKRATACLLDTEYERLHSIDKELLTIQYKRLEKAVNSLLDL